MANMGKNSITYLPEVEGGSITSWLANCWDVSGVHIKTSKNKITVEYFGNRKMAIKEGHEAIIREAFDKLVKAGYTQKSQIIRMINEHVGYSHVQIVNTLNKYLKKLRGNAMVLE